MLSHKIFKQLAVLLRRSVKFELAPDSGMQNVQGVTENTEQCLPKNQDKSRNQYKSDKSGRYGTSMFIVHTVPG